jgi:NADH-quinone oxidoreductase subunit E
LNTLLEKYPTEVQAILAKYPSDQKRSAVMPLLYLAQREFTVITKSSMQDIAEICNITPTEVASIIGFYTLYHDSPRPALGEGQGEGSAPKYRIQVCTDLPCALRGADQFLENLCENLGIQLGPSGTATTPDGSDELRPQITIEAVMCLAGCDKAPMFQVQSGDGLEYHENQTVESALDLIATLRKPVIASEAKQSDS